jgi:hypothetical protein
MGQRLLRLRLKTKDAWEWLHHTWWFQWAHSPLCQRYRIDVLRLGRLHLCRSCTLIYGGFFLGAGMFFLLPTIRNIPFYSLTIVLLAVLTLSYPPLYHHWSRPVRDVVRFVAGVAGALFLGVLFLQSYLVIGGALALLALAYLWFRHRRRMVKLKACDGCPELGLNKVCSGYELQADSIRAYRDVMDEEWNKPYALPLVMPPGPMARCRR